MASLKDLRKRIQSVRSTRQITKAMKMVSAAKLRKSQEALLSLRPYAYKLIGLINALKDRMGDYDHPLLSRREIKRTRLVIMSSDRGLCGSYNSNIIKKAEHYIKEAGLNADNCVMDFIGKKAYEYFNKRYTNIGDNYRVDDKSSAYQNVSYFSDRIIENYIEGDFDSLVVIYNEFKSAMSQKITVQRLFPIVTPEYEEVLSLDNFMYEPNKHEVLDELLPKYVKIEGLRIMLEGLASEHGARMTAMENATKNSDDMIKRLSVVYNRRRQSTITTELMEIVGGKEALEKG